MRTGVRLAGRFRLRFAHAKRGLAWDLDLCNGVTTQGATHLLARGFKGAAAQSWYLGVISAAGYAAVAASDTHASHAGWSEFVSLSSGTRATWNPAAAQGGRTASAGARQMAVSAAGSVRGVFLASRAAIGDAGAAGILYSTAVAEADYAVSAGGVLYVTYSLNAAG